MISDVKDAVARVVALAAIGAGDEAADVHALVVEVLADRESGAATAGN
jgi:hypothetical protein